MLTPEDLEQIRSIIQPVEARLILAQERAVEAMATNLSDLRGELVLRAQATERSLERVVEALRGLQTQIMGLNRWADTLDRDNTALGTNYHNHDREIRELRARVEALEQRK